MNNFNWENHKRQITYDVVDHLARPLLTHQAGRSKSIYKFKNISSKVWPIYILICWHSFFSSTSFSKESSKVRYPKAGDFNGQWVIREVVDVAPILPIDEETLSALPGKILKISRKEISFENYKCSSPELKFETINTKRFFNEYRIDVPKGLAKSVTTFTVICDGKDTFDFSPVIVRQNLLMLIWRGALVSLARK